MFGDIGVYNSNHERKTFSTYTNILEESYLAILDKLILWQRPIDRISYPYVSSIKLTQLRSEGVLS